MDMQPHIDIPYEQIEAFCQKWQIAEFALFGSVLRDDFNQESDIDVLIAQATGVHWNLFDLGEMAEELQLIFNRHVDIIPRDGLEKSRNRRLRQSILNHSLVIHAA
jgi:uncharacterized protein